jgi:hypothetical protein
MKVTRLSPLAAAVKLIGCTARSRCPTFSNRSQRRKRNYSRPITNFKKSKPSSISNISKLEIRIRFIIMLARLIKYNERIKMTNLRFYQALVPTRRIMGRD